LYNSGSLQKGERNYGVAGVFLFLAISIFIYVRIFGVNVLYLDEWDFASLVRKYQSDGFSFSLFFQAHNEHRIFFPQLLYILVLPLSHMNSKMFMYLNAVLVCIECLFLYLGVRKQFRFPLSRIPVMILIIPLFVFNFRQWQNLIWAFQIAFYMVLVSSVISLYLVEKAFSSGSKKSKITWLLMAAVFAIIATFSSAMGILVWIAAGVQILIKKTHSGNPGTQMIALSWVAAGILAFLLYTHGLESGLGSNLIFAVKHPFTFIHFFFSLLSLTSIHSLSIVAFPAGIALFAGSVFILHKTWKDKRLDDNSFWIALYVFSVLFALLTTLGRCPITFEYTDRSRYTVFTALFIVSTFMLFYDSYRLSSIRKERRLLNGFFLFLVLLAVELNAIGLVFGVNQKKQREIIKETVLNYKTRPMDDLKKIDPWLDDKFIRDIKESIPFIEKNHYNVFSEKN
jgi:hypothetical protein